MAGSNQQTIPETSCSCAVCQQVTQDPKWHPNCGALFCGGCVEQAKAACPSCKGLSPTYCGENRGQEKELQLQLQECGDHEIGAEIPKDIESIILSRISSYGLQGILMTGKAEDLLKERLDLLELPKVITTKVYEETENVIHFFSESDEQKYELAMKYSIINKEEIKEYQDILGWSTSIDDPASPSHYLSTLKQVTLSIAQARVELSELALSVEAKKYLIEILNDTGSMHSKCIDFFSKYGSHILAGPFNFGGHLLLKCSSKYFKNNEKCELLEMHKNLVSTSPETNIPPNYMYKSICIDEKKKEYLGKFCKETVDNTCLYVEAMNGKTDAYRFSEWKDVQQEFTSSILIDRGKNLVAVWDIITHNYKEELGQLADVLKISWESMTGIHTEVGSLQMRNILENCDSLKSAVNSTESPSSGLTDTHVQSDSLSSSTHKNNVTIQELIDCSTLLDKNELAHSILHVLNLCQRYSQKFKLVEAMEICLEPLNISLQEPKLSSMHQLPRLILHKLMSYDSSCRSHLVSDHSDCEFDSSSDSDSESECGLFDIWDQNRICNIHPVDCLLAVLYCCDPFLKQDLFSRLAKCQLAVPFILANPFDGTVELQIWGLKSIVKEWKTIVEDSQLEHERLIVNQPMHMISFIRFGNQTSAKSKSMILNELISNNKYNHFFHRDCPGGDRKCILGEGCVSMMWYLPSGIQSDIFSKPITFFNLHGDARKHYSQSMFISEISIMCFVMLNEDLSHLDDKSESILNQIYSSSIGITFLIGCKQTSSLQEKYPNAYIIDLTKRSFSHQTNKIRKIIKKLLIEVDNIKSITCDDLVTTMKKHEIASDEDYDYEIGHLHAEKVYQLVQECTIIGKFSKEILLPLQGKKLWKTWTMKDKELYETTLKDDELDVVKKIEEEKDKIRTKQHATIQSKIMKAFIDSLYELGGSEKANVRSYFIHCLKQKLNSFSNERVLKLQQDYEFIRSMLSADNHSENKSSQLEEIRNDITENSIGIEHLFREVGQVYEASLIEPGTLPKYSQLCKAAAEVLIEGYPLELMDGDTSHVPLEWVTAVLEEAAVMLNNPKIFVFSVLGLQNTGKSTMLNTIFGLQFKVSGGKCTCGAFMQLLRMDKELMSKTGCQFLLVIDTEGLRAPAVNSQKRQRLDNELATLVIGLGDVTLINIYGTITGDIDDILLTSVHAFLRMSEVKFHPSCRFIHQNAESTVKDITGKDRLIEKLDQMSVTVAKEEKLCTRKIKKFSDVVNFNDHTNIHYFPTLWSGDPPMAPVNPGYTKATQSLKLKLILDMCDRSNSCSSSSLTGTCGAPMTSFGTKVRDLWNSLLKENFIFSFKNTLEMSAYNELELEYIKWELDFQDAMIKWERQAGNEINSVALESCDEVLNMKYSDLEEILSENYEKIKCQMEEFFNGNNKEILIHWKSKIEIRLSHLKEEHYLHSKEFCQNVVENRKSSATFEAEKKEIVTNMKKILIPHIENKRKHKDLYFQITNGTINSKEIFELLQRDLFSDQKLNVYERRKIITKEKGDEIRIKWNQDKSDDNLVKVLALLGEAEFDKILNEEQLNVLFEEIWNSHSPVNRKIQAIRIPVLFEVKKALFKYVGPKDKRFLTDKLNKKMLNDWSISQIAELFSNDSDQNKSKAVQLKKHIKIKVSECLNDIKSGKTDFCSTYVYQLLKIVDDAISKSEYSAMITHEKKYDLYLSVCGFALSEFEIMAKNYEEELVKGPLFMIFKNQYQQTEAEVAIADTLCAYISEPIKKQVQRMVVNKMPDKLASLKTYFRSKNEMRMKVLIDLLESNNSDWEDYLKNTSGFIEKKLRVYIKEDCDEKISSKRSLLQTLLIDELSSLISNIEVSIHGVNDTGIEVSKWLSIVCDTIGSKIGVNLNVSDLLADHHLSQESAITDLKNNISNGLHMLKKTLEACFAGSLYLQIDWGDTPPTESLKRKVIGCTELCPFCGEQCDLLNTDHFENGQDHRTEFHRMICLNGWSTDRNRIFSTTRKMTMEFCPVLLSTSAIFTLKDGSSLSFREYKSVYKNWSIYPDLKYKGSLFWKSFLVKYSECIAANNKERLPEIPNEWIGIKEDTIKENLKDLYCPS